MLNYHGFESQLKKQGMQDWAKWAVDKAHRYFLRINHGDYSEWKQAVERVSPITACVHELNADCIQIGTEQQLNRRQREQLNRALTTLIPWRKGPFKIFGIELDAEWRCDLKWNRIQEHLSKLDGRMVLDIGCGNGYYGWRMIGQGAACVIGVDPTLRFVMQFQLVKQCMPAEPFYFLPFGIQDIIVNETHFDTVFSMGVIYHRRHPIEHCQQLYSLLRSGGELVLEGLIVRHQETLIPKQRYAKMNNVWHIPNVETLLNWLEKSGFVNARVVDISVTTVAEQRRTEWMLFESLNDFLDPNDHSKTIEGYPAPIRATVIANKP